MDLLDIKKQFLILLFCIFSFNFSYSYQFKISDYSNTEKAAVATGVAKFPLAIAEDLCHFNESEKKAIIFGCMYHANNILHLGLKLNARQGSNVSFFEFGYGVYDLIKFIEKLSMIFCKNVKTKDVTIGKSADKINKKSKRLKDKQVIYTILKYLAFLIEADCSVDSVLCNSNWFETNRNQILNRLNNTDANIARAVILGASESIYSNVACWSRVFASSIDNKNGKISSHPKLWGSLVGGGFATILLVFLNFVASVVKEGASRGIRVSINNGNYNHGMNNDIDAEEISLDDLKQRYSNRDFKECPLTYDFIKNGDEVYVFNRCNHFVSGEGVKQNNEYCQKDNYNYDSDSGDDDDLDMLYKDNRFISHTHAYCPVCNEVKTGLRKYKIK